MKLSELIAAVGDEHIQLQNLLDSADNISQTKHGTKVSFFTNQITATEVALGQTKKLGLVIWLPCDRMPRIARFDQQFAETTDERNERLRERRRKRTIETLHRLVADLSGHLTDEGDDCSPEGLDAMRRRVANALPPDMCPDWLAKYRDPDHDYAQPRGGIR